MTDHTAYPEEFLVYRGGLAEGLEFYGPFFSRLKAQSWITDHVGDGVVWRIVPLNRVKDQK